MKVSGIKQKACGINGVNGIKQHNGESSSNGGISQSK